jgi:hypothetical protein
MNRLGIALMAVFAAAFPATVRAQQGNVLEEFENDGFPFDRRGIIGVRDRPQPEYDPVPIRIGSTEFMPTIGTYIFYDSNIFAEPEAEDDVVIRVRPSLSSSSRVGSLTVTTETEIDRRQYLGTPSQSTTDYALGLRGRYDVSRDTRLYAGTRNGRRTEDRADPDSPFNLRRPARYDYASAYFTGAHSINRLQIATRIAAETRNYSDGRNGAGAPVDQDFRNRTLLTADVATGYAVSPVMSVFVAASLNDRNYGQQPALAPARDSSGYRIAAGGSFEFRQLLRGQFDLGYFKQNFADRGFKSVGGLAARAKLEYFATPLITLTARARRGVEESSTLGSGAYIATAFSLAADYEFLRNVVFSASIAHERNRFTDIDRRYRIHNARVAVEWKLSPRFALTAQYDYRDQNAVGTSPGREFSRHSVQAGITITGL